MEDGQVSGRTPTELLLSRLDGVRRNGTGHMARCPAHDDKVASLSVTTGSDGRVLIKCFAGCAAEAVAESVGLKMKDLFPQTASSPPRNVSSRRSTAPITVADLARDKVLPEEFLRGLGLEDRPDGVLIPYRLMDGFLASRQRIRKALVAKEGSTWLPGDGAPVPYGRDRVQDAQERGYVVFIEGESDAATLWLHGYPGIGVPGSTQAKTIQKEHLAGIECVYYWREPDQGGDTFAAGIAARLREIGFRGAIREMKIDGVKDVNDLHRREPAGFDQAFCRAMEEAVPVAPLHGGTGVVLLEEMRARSVRELVQDNSLVEPEQVIEGLIALGELTVLGGPPKAMKSWTVKTIGLHIAGGRPWMGFNVPRPYKVLYLSAEGREVRLRARFQKLIAYADVTEEGLDNLEYLCTMGRLKIDTESGEQTFLRLIEPFQVVIIDPYYRFISNGDENSHKDQRVVQDLLDRVKTLGKCILLVHHTRKPTGIDSGISELRGAGLDGYADGVLMLRRKKEKYDDRFTLQFTLRNYDEPPEMELVREGVTLIPGPHPDIRLLCNPMDVVQILSGKELPGDELKKALAEEKECSQSTVERAITKALDENLIAYKPKPGKGRGRIYFRPEDQTGGHATDQSKEKPQ